MLPNNSHVNANRNRSGIEDAASQGARQTGTRRTPGFPKGTALCSRASCVGIGDPLVNRWVSLAKGANGDETYLTRRNPFCFFRIRRTDQKDSYVCGVFLEENQKETQQTCFMAKSPTGNPLVSCWLGFEGAPKGNQPIRSPICETNPSILRPPHV